MIIFKDHTALKKHLYRLKTEGKLGFVPTMGALHAGHLQLIRTAKEENTAVVSSIFVNPAQFNDPRDFQKYPITLEQDIRLLEKEKCDVLFLPEVSEIYPNGYSQLEKYDLGRLDTILEGSSRPGHFQGVCQVVNRLLDMVEPHQLYLGQKDYQQCMVIQRLVNLTGKSVALRICPTRREENGLAMSSRNMRLTPAAREKASAIFLLLTYAKSNIQPGDLSGLQQYGTQFLSQRGFNPDYVSFANAGSLELRENWDGEESLVMLIAAFIEEVRLIDNMIIT
jgi:pantoate--beta-alanine ligase